jgi:hypothetical protein
LNNLKEEEINECTTIICSMCLTCINENDNVTMCSKNDLFHTLCLKSWLNVKNVCPVCYITIDESKIKSEPLGKYDKLKYEEMKKETLINEKIKRNLEMFNKIILNEKVLLEEKQQKEIEILKKEKEKNIEFQIYILKIKEQTEFKKAKKEYEIIADKYKDNLFDVEYPKEILIIKKKYKNNKLFQLFMKNIYGNFEDNYDDFQKNCDKYVQDNRTVKCSICLDCITSREFVMYCPNLHIFHEKCIVEQFKINNKCPECRIEFNLGDRNLFGTYNLKSHELKLKELRELKKEEERERKEREEIERKAIERKAIEREIREKEERERILREKEERERIERKTRMLKEREVKERERIERIEREARKVKEREVREREEREERQRIIRRQKLDAYMQQEATKIMGIKKRIISKLRILLPENNTLKLDSDELINIENIIEKRKLDEINKYIEEYINDNEKPYFIILFKFIILLLYNDKFSLSREDYKFAKQIIYNQDNEFYGGNLIKIFN